MLFRPVLHVWRKVRSILLLLITAGILFYYSFQNEIEHLNTFAEVESLPMLQKQEISSKQVEEKTRGQPPGSNGSQKSNTELLEKAGILEKNKYFPILLDDSDDALIYTHDDYVRKEVFHPFHPFYEKKTIIPYKQINDEYPSLNLVSSKESNRLIKDELRHHWIRRLSRVPDVPFLDLRTNVSIVSTNSFLGINDSSVCPFITIGEFSDPIDQRLWSGDILAGLLSVPKLKTEENRRLLNLAQEIGSMLLQSYDTPNFLPQIPFFWKSFIRNRYAFRRTTTSGMAANIIEFLELSHISNDPQFDSVISKFLRTLTQSYSAFDIDYILPGVVDASGCRLISDEKIGKGEHLRELNTLKSIQRGEFVHCTVMESLQPPENADWNIISLDTVDLYLTMLKAYHLNNGNLYETSNKRDSVALYLMHTIKAINKTMLFQPWFPVESNDLLLPTSLKSNIHFDVSDDSNDVAVGRQYRVTPEGAKMSSLFSIAGVLFNDSSLIERSKSITNGYYELYKLLKEIPDVIILDKMQPMSPTFDAKKKIELIKSGYYNPKKNMQQGVKLNGASKERIKHYRMINSFTYTPSMEDINEEHLCWRSHSWPFYVNHMKPSSQPPFDLIESLVYLYKISGDYQWRLIGEELMHSIEWSQLTVSDTSKLVRLFYALFEDDVNVDEYIINSGYHFLARSAELNPKLKKQYHKFSDLDRFDD